MAKNKKQGLLQKQVKELFVYKNGKLYWKSKISHSTKSIGEKVGSSCRVIPRVKIYGQYYRVHRLVYLLHHGFCPKKISFKDKTLTSEGMYDISIENLYEPSKQIKVKKNFKSEISFAKVCVYFEYKEGRLYWKKSRRSIRV